MPLCCAASEPDRVSLLEFSNLYFLVAAARKRTCSRGRFRDAVPKKDTVSTVE